MNAILRGNDPSAARLVEALAGSSLLGSTAIISPTATGSETPVDGLVNSILPVEQSHSNTGSLGDISAVLSSLAPDHALLTDMGTHGSTSPLPLAGDGTLPQPVLDAANTLVLDVHSELEILSDQTGVPAIVHGITNLGETVGLGKLGDAPAPDGPTNLLTDVLNAPGDLLSGDLNGVISNVGHDLSDVINAVSSLKDVLVFGHDDALNPIPEILDGVGSALSSTPLLTLNGGNNADDGGLLGGIVGDLGHSSSGHLVDADVGPEQQNGLVLDLLAPHEAGPHHAVEVNGVDVGQNGPHLLDLGLITGQTGNGGLLGNVLNVAGSQATAAAPSSTSPLPDVLHEVGLGDIAGADHGILDLHHAQII